MKKPMSIAEIKEKLFAEQFSPVEMNVLRQDSRKGVQKLLKTYNRKQKLRKLEQEAFQEKWRFDQRYKISAETFIAGVDEAGRGPLAGPVVAAAVILQDDFPLIGLNDSKQLSALEREKLYDLICQHALSYHIASIDAQEIDKINIYEATKKSMRLALNGLTPQPDVVLIDAVDLDMENITIQTIIKGDQKSLAIAAASILAKVTRDRIMQEIDAAYPMYGFGQNKGYGTKEHLAALQQYGPSPFHRKSFSPVKKCVASPSVQQLNFFNM